MKKEQNLQEPQKQALNIPVVSKRKYWYRDDVDVCVLCGKETHNKERVYSEDEKGTFWKDGACHNHF
ncbi:MAG: hypothetical protein ACOYMA_22215 [Bacteroidia bacterium]